MGNDVAANRFLRVSRKHGSSINLCDHLVCNDNSDAKLISHALQMAQKLG
jgi:hypothetical protein